MGAVTLNQGLTQLSPEHIIGQSKARKSDPPKVKELQVEKGGSGLQVSNPPTPVSLKILQVRQNHSTGSPEEGANGNGTKTVLINPPQIGNSVIQDKDNPSATYLPTSPINSGGMGEVYKAINQTNGQEVAIKFLKPGNVNIKVLRRFLREAKALTELTHENIVRVYDFGEDASCGPFLVQEYLNGKGLDIVIAEFHKSRDPNNNDNLKTLLQKISKVASALAYAHEVNIFHRDIKPANIIVVDKRPVILDFGLAKVPGTSMITSGEMFGTPEFIAPEQVSGDPVDGRADLYALGVILYLIVAGRLPFIGKGTDETARRASIVIQHLHTSVTPPFSFRQDFPSDLEPIILKLLGKDPNSRHQTGRQLAFELERVIRIIEREASPTERPLVRQRLAAI